MNVFQPQDYGPQIAKLLTPERLNELGPGKPNEAVRKRLEGLNPKDLAATWPANDLDMSRACCAGLWLYHDFLHQSHEISQSIETNSGSYWHGIMHRREPDAGNAKYWFHRVGQHPVFKELAGQAAALEREAGAETGVKLGLIGGAWDPFRFIDLCEQVRESGSPVELLCRRIAQAEWRLLFDYCWRGGVASG